MYNTLEKLNPRIIKYTFRTKTDLRQKFHMMSLAHVSPRYKISNIYNELCEDILLTRNCFAPIDR